MLYDLCTLYAMFVCLVKELVKTCAQLLSVLLSGSPCWSGCHSGLGLRFVGAGR